MQKREFIKWWGFLCDDFKDFDEFAKYDKMYGIASKLGFTSAQEAWDANPFVRGSLNPHDYRRILKVVVELQIDTNNQSVPEWKIREGARQAVQNMLEMGEKNGFPHDHDDAFHVGQVSVIMSDNAGGML